MLYFRFDRNKDDFKGSEHNSVFMGDEVYEYCDELFENGDAPEEYQKEYDDGNFDIIDDYIENELTVSGCSCFELDASGIEMSKGYAFYDTHNWVTVFEGDFLEYGHDGEPIVKCTNIIEQLPTDKFVDKYVE